MRSFWQGIVALGSALALTACVAGGGGAAKPSASNPITGGEIEVTVLDPAPAPATAGKPVAPVKPGEPVKPAEKPPASKPVDKPEVGPKLKPEAVKEAVASEEIAAPEAAAPAPEAEKSAAQISCERKGDIWAKAGDSGAHSCVKRTRDGGKRCKTGKECQGDCLARSNSCAPYAPLFGCNEILQDDGVRMTLCLD